MIRPYRAEDRPAVELICQTAGLRGKLREYFADTDLFARLWLAPFLDGEPESCWVAEVDGVVVGYLVSAVRPRFRRRALRHLVPPTLELARRWILGRYRHDPASSRFARWFLFRAWREAPPLPTRSTNFHFNVLPDARGGRRLGDALVAAYFEKIGQEGHATFHAHVFASAGKRDLGFYRNLGFRILDVRESRLFVQPTLVASLEREVPEDLQFMQRRPRHLSRISVIIPCHNEAELLPALLNDLRNQALPADEVIVVADACTDRTVDLAREARAIVVEGVFGHAGISRNAGIARATGDTLVLLDADTRIPTDFLAQVHLAVERGATCGGPWLRPDDSSLAARVWVLGQNVVSRVVRCSYGTAFFATRRSFETAGGYDESLRWAEDVEVAMRHARRGRFVHLPTRAIYNCRRLRENGAWRELASRLLRSWKHVGPVMARQERDRSPAASQADPSAR